MGIKNFRSNLNEKFPDITNNIKPKNVFYLCIDCNFILHKICNKAKDNYSFKKHLIKALNKIIYTIKPKFVAIFLDGQAILAKAFTQIKRRDKYLYNKSKGLSPLNLTPGTPFMDFVDEIITEYLSQLKIDCYYSSSKENNEGELKLFNWLKNTDYKKNSVIVGNDSDLIILALAYRPLLNIYIYNYENYLSLFKLIKNLSFLVTKNFDYKWHPIRLDFVLLSFFQGNDYNSRISNFDNLFISYNKLQEQKKEFLIKKNGEINLLNLKYILSNIKIKDFNIYSKNDVDNYFKSIKWNLNLYQNKINTKYIPEYKNININSILKFYPTSIDNIVENIDWLNKNAYLLLLMPKTGKNLLPTELQFYMEEQSPVKDLFPDPCLECIKFKNQINSVEKPDENCSNLILDEYKLKISKLNLEYSEHLNNNHKINKLPIKRLEELFSIE